MTTVWDAYPADYRSIEMQQISRAVCAGECLAVIGLSGSGKSNLLGFLAQRMHLPSPCPQFLLVDCNRLVEPGAAAFFRFLRRAVEDGGSSAVPPTPADDELLALDEALNRRLAGERGLCLLLDRFDALFKLELFNAMAGGLRALRDAHKYRLTYVTAARLPLADDTELAELFFGHTLWLGPLSHSDALWSARRDAQRYASWEARDWSEAVLEKLVAFSWGYPSLLRAACEAYASGAALDSGELRAHPAVARRVAEFWADAPDPQALRLARLEGHPWLAGRPVSEAQHPAFDTAQLTAKEHLLLEYLQAHAGQVCEKDDLVHAVWPEDVIYEQGIRDESLAQLVRRLRVKIEPDPAEPAFIQTVPGRGYLFRSLK